MFDISKLPPALLDVLRKAAAEDYQRATVDELVENRRLQDRIPTMSDAEIMAYLQEPLPPVDHWFVVGVQMGLIDEATSLPTALGRAALEMHQTPPADEETGRPLGPDTELDIRVGDQSADELPWAGDEWDDLAPLIRRLLRHMNGREEERIENLVEYVWEAPLEKIKGGAIHTAINRANKFLSKHNHRRLLSKVRGKPVIRWL